MNMEDAAGFFANVFGGERFVDYVRAHLPMHCKFTHSNDSDRRNLNHERHDFSSNHNDDGRRKNRDRETAKQWIELETLHSSRGRRPASNICSRNTSSACLPLHRPFLNRPFLRRPSPSRLFLVCSPRSFPRRDSQW